MFVAIVFPLEQDVPALQGNKSFIGNGNPMSVAAEIGVPPVSGLRRVVSLTQGQRSVLLLSAG